MCTTFHRILILASLLLSVMCVFRRICRDMCRGIELWQRKQSDAENSIIWPPNTRILWMSTNVKNFGKSSAKFLPNRTGQNQPNPEPKFRSLPNKANDGGLSLECAGIIMKKIGRFLLQCFLQVCKIQVFNLFRLNMIDLENGQVMCARRGDNCTSTSARTAENYQWDEFKSNYVL